MSKEVERYRARAKDRLESRRKDQTASLPNLAEANAMYNPKDGVKTVAQIKEMVSAVRQSSPHQQSQPGLSPDTIKGMQQLHSEMMRKKEEMTSEAEPAPAPETPAPAKTTPARPKNEALVGALSHVDEESIERLIENIRTDILNNEQDRKKIEEGLEPIDLARALGENEVTQRVPIKPGLLDVTFRSVTGYENQKIRVVIQDLADEDPKLISQTGDMYYLFQLACSIVSINGDVWPLHLSGAGYRREFLPEVAVSRYRKLLWFPQPIIHSLGVHVSWFDSRVREALRVGK